MAVLIDSNVIISFLIQSDKTDEARKLLEKIDEPVTILNVVEETIYIGLSLIYGVRGPKLKEEIKKGLNDTAKYFLKSLESFLVDFEVKLVEPPNKVNLLIEIIEKYGLLPNDALIAATCKLYGLRIATFDEDFRRVEFLEVIS